MFKIQVLVSGAGSTLDNLAEQCYDDFNGRLHNFVKIERVVADRECAARAIAEKWNLPFEVIKRSDYEDREQWSEALFNCDVDLHVMGGFLSQVVVPDRWNARILNIHPSIKAKYSGKGMYGIKVHEAVVRDGEKITGCTVHVVDNNYDEGPVIAQEAVAVMDEDTPDEVQRNVQKREQLLYPRVILDYLKKIR